MGAPAPSASRDGRAGWERGMLLGRRSSALRLWGDSALALKEFVDGPAGLDSAELDMAFWEFSSPVCCPAPLEEGWVSVGSGVAGSRAGRLTSAPRGAACRGGGRSWPKEGNGAELGGNLGTVVGCRYMKGYPNAWSGGGKVGGREAWCGAVDAGPFVLLGPGPGGPPTG